MQDSLHENGRLGFWNVLLAVGIFGLTFAALAIWSVPGVDPSLWDELAVVSGLRPPQALLPGYWRGIVGGLVRLVGMDRAMQLLPWLGYATGALSSALFCLIVRQVLSFEIRTVNRYAVWDRCIAPVFSFGAAVLFGVSEPLAQASQTLTPDGVKLLLLLLSVFFIFRWLLRGGVAFILIAYLLAGALAAETPLAFLLPVVSMFAYWMEFRKIAEGQMTKPERFLEPYQIPRWKMFFLFFFALVAGIVMNLMFFERYGGPAANGWRIGTSVFRYAVHYMLSACMAVSPLGWLLAVCFSIVPFVLGVWIAPRIISDERRMTFGFGLLMVFVGVMAFMQSGVFPFARFWTFDIDSMSVQDGFMLQVFLLMDFCALAIVGAALMFECQRTYREFEREQALDALDDARMSADDDEAEEVGQEIVGWMGAQQDHKIDAAILKVIVPLVFAAVVGGAVWRSYKPEKVEMQRIIDEAVREIVEECGDAHWLFSDGRLDPAIELESQRRGGSLRVLNMMSDSAPWAVSVRKRGFETSSNDCIAVETGVPVLFRTWAEREGGFDDAAFQFGFEYWQRERKDLPRLSGLVGRTKGLDEQAAEKGIVRTRALAERIMALPEPHLNTGISMLLYRTFYAVSWRIARIAGLRDERGLSERLIENNGIMKRITGVVERERQRTFMQLTPKEGLRLALRRTDFAEARRRALVVLKDDEDDLQANFAMAMSAISLNRLTEAETYLRRCHAIHPKEPAVINNLSIVCRKLGHYEEAVQLAQEAAKLMPNSREIRRSLEDAKRQAAKAAEGGSQRDQTGAAPTAD